MSTTAARIREIGTRLATKGQLARCSLLLAFVGACAAGCAGAAQVKTAEAPPPPDVVAAAPPPVVVADSYGSGAAPAPQAVVAPMEREARRERPGLGTEWGEDRESPVHDVAFFRADERRPLATAELRYDDARGVAALAAYVRDPGQRMTRSSAAGGAITIWLEDGNQSPLGVVETGGHTLVVGEAGERYAIFLQNHTGHRFEAVTTVDGLDVINGKAGSVSNRGYLLMPYATLEIDGFRRSEETVAAFRFGRVADAYAAKVGAARDVGVIGMAFFGERGDSWFPGRVDDEARRRASATPFPADRFAPPPGW